MKVLAHLAAAAAALLLSPGACADGWPVKPVRVVLPTAAGSAPDVIARLLGERLGQLWKQPVIVENKPGASGVIGISAFKQAPADQHGFLLAQAAVIAVTPRTLANPRFDVDADMTPIALVALSPMMILARQEFGANTLAEAFALARSDRQPITVAATGQYSIPHLSAEYIRKAAGLDVNIVSFGSTGGALNALVNGDAQLMVDGIPGVGAMRQSGRIKALATTASERLPGEPKLPTLAETLPGSPELSGWFVLFGRKNASAEVVERVNRDVRQVLQDPRLAARFVELGVFPRALTPAETARFVADERQRWGRVLDGLKIEAR